MASGRARPVPRTFLFADLRGYTAYVERAGDAAASRLITTYRALVRRAVARERGAEVKTEGDSFYVVFDSSAAAVRCAVAIQRAAARHHQDPLPIGIGIHAGEATPLDRQYVGSAVNIAARLAAAAAAGEILVSETVRGLVRTAVRVPFEDRGALSLKGIAEPIRAYAIRLPRPAPTAVTAAPTSAMDAVARGDLEGAMRLARAASAQAPVEARCDALAALTILAAIRGDVEVALGRTERLLPLALRAAERSWVRVAYALRAWLYCLARQPEEGRAELERALERPGQTREACLTLLLAATLAGTALHGQRLRHGARACPDRAMEAAHTAVADVLEGGGAAAAATGPWAMAGPLFGPLLRLQLTARFHGEISHDLRAAASNWGGDGLAELILKQ